MKKTVFLAAVAVVWSGSARANAFDDCVLKNMQGVTPDVAAKSIEVAFIRKSSVTMTDEDIKGLKLSSSFYGTFGMMHTPGFTAEVKNNTVAILARKFRAPCSCRGSKSVCRWRVSIVPKT